MSPARPASPQRRACPALLRKGAGQIAQLRFDSPLGTGTHFDPANHILQADMLRVTIAAGDSYPVSADLGTIADSVPRPGC